MNVTSGTSSQNIGGLVGNNEGSGGNISIAYTSGNINPGSGSSNIGGLVGDEASTNVNAIANTYSISNITVSSATNVGGLVGNQTAGPVATSYSTGSVPGSGTNIGGFIGDAGITTNTNNFYDTTSSGTGTAAGTGSTLGITKGCFTGTCPNGGTANLSSTTTFSGATWSISAGPSASLPASIWLILSGQTRPMLTAEWSASVSTPHQLQLMNFDLGGTYSLSGNVNLNVVNSNGADVWGGSGGLGFEAIGNTSIEFTGQFNGNGNTISNLYMNTAVTTGTGLFGATSSAATISNVNLTSVNITNTATSASLIALDVGALVGQNNGTISQSSSAGSVSVSGNFVSNIGGLVGQNNNIIDAPTNNYSYSTTTVTSSGNNNANIGGLIGQNGSASSVDNIYSAGAVFSEGNAATSIGGLVGDNQGAISNGYSSTPVTASGLTPSNIGDLAGTNEGAGTISITYSDANIAATDAATTATNVGGFIGYENSSSATAIQNTYSWSGITLSGNGTDVGGMIGNQANGPIIDSYSIGAANVSGTKTNVAGFIGATSITSNSENFFDTTTSGTATGVASGSTNGVTGDPTATMKLLSTFNSAGWNFTTPIWGILDTISYPYFSGLTLGVEVIDPAAGSLPTAATGGNILTPLLSATSGVDYFYLFKETALTAGNGILFYNTTGTVANGILVVPAGTNYTTPITLTMTANAIQVGGSNTASIGSNNFGSSAAGGANVLFSTGGSLTLGDATYPNVTLLSNANTTLTINGGVNSTGTDDVMTLAGPVTINNGGASISTSGTQTYNGTVTLQSAATFATSSTAGSVVINGNINGGTSALTFNNVDANSIISGVYSGSGGLNMEGTGTLTLANNNNYSGNTIITNGTLELNSSGITPTPLGTSTLDFNGGTLTAGSTLSGPVANAYVTGGVAFISTIGGSNNLNLSGPGIFTSNYTLNIDNTAVTTLSGNISGGGQLNEIGGTLALSGSNNSSYSGSAAISGNGTLQVDVATNVLGTGTLALNGGNIIAEVPSVAITNAFTANSISSVEGTNDINFSGPVSLYSGALSVTNTGTTTFSGNLTGAGGLTVNNGAGTVVVSGANNAPYLGATTITAGTLELSSATDALGTGTGNSLVLNGGTMYASLTATLANKFLVGGSGSADISGSNSISIAGNGTLNNVLNITNTAGTITLSGVVNNGTSTGSIVENGAGGTLVLSGNNTFGATGVTGTTESAGTLIAENSRALGVGNSIVSSGAELELNGVSSSINVANPLSLNGSGVGGAGALVDADTNGDNNIASGLITLTGNATIGVTSPTTAESLTLSGGITNAGHTTTFTTTSTTSAITESGVISGSAGGLQMTGNGTLNLSGTNTFTGNNTVSGGTVAVSNAQGLGLGNTTTIDSGAIVKVAGAALVASEAFNLNGGTLEGTKVGALQASAAGAITLAQGSADSIATLAAADNFTLSGAMNGTSGVNNGDLTLSGPGTITLSTTVGSTTAIDSLTDSSTTLSLGGGAITSVANQAYNGAVTLTANATLKTTGTGNISFTNALTGAHTLTLTSAGNITESGSGALKNVTTLTTNSATGTTLNGANTVTTFNATDVSSTGIALTNTIGTLSVSGASESGSGNININNTGIIADSGTINTANDVTLTASSSISQTGKITNAALLTTNSKGGTVLSGANTVAGFNATNITSGNITLVNTAAPLAITGISQSGGGNTSVTNTGAMNVNGAITGGAGTVTLTATGALLSVNSNISTTNKAIALAGSGITQNVGASASTIVNAGSGNISYTAGSGTITTTSNGSFGSQILSTGVITLVANAMAIDTTANSQIGGTGIGTGVASNVVLDEGTSTTPIFVSTTGAGLQLSATVLNAVHATDLRIGDGNSGLITVGAWTPTQAYASSPGVVTFDSGAGIIQTGALALGASSNLIIRGAGNDALTNTANVINNIATLSSGSLSVVNSGTNALTVASLTDDLGTVNGINAIGGVTLKTTNASSSLILNQGISANTSGYDIVLVTPLFTNNDGASALSPGSGNYFQVWSTTPVNDTHNGMTSNFIEYNVIYANNPTLAQATGNAYLYTLAPVVTPTLVGVVQKVYDGNNAATLTAGNYSDTGAVNGDVITFNNPTSGTYDTPQAGTGKTVSVTGISLPTLNGTNGSANVYGYTLGSTTASAPIGIITGQPLTIINFSAFNKIYDTTTTATINNPGILSGTIVGGDSVSLNISSISATFSTANVGNGLTVTGTGYSLSGTSASNYTLTNPNPTTLANITPYTLTVSGVLANNKTYDGTTVATLNTGSASLATVYPSDVGNVSVSSTGYTATFASSHVANNIGVSISNLGLTGSAAGNYQLTQPTGLAANIVPATLTAVLTNTNVTKSYDGTLSAPAGFTPTYQFTGLVPGDTTATIANTGSLYNNAHVANATTVTVSGLSLVSITGSNSSVVGDYNFVTSSLAVAATITPATLTAVLTNTNVTKTYNGTTSAPVGFTPTYQFTGLISGDTTATITNTGSNYNSAHVANATTVTVNGLSLASITGSNSSVASDYNFTPTSLAVAATITPLP